MAQEIQALNDNTISANHFVASVKASEIGIFSLICSVLNSNHAHSEPRKVLFM